MRFSFQFLMQKQKQIQKQTEATKAAHNYQRKICVSLLRKLIRSYLEKLNVKHVRDNKKYWKKVAPLFFK